MYTIDNRIEILKVHGIDYTVQDGVLFALDVVTCYGASTVRCQWIDLTDINIFNWLGY